MARKKAHTPEEIVAKLRQAEVLIGPGQAGGGGGPGDRRDGADMA